MFGFKGVGDYERGVARQERVAPFSLRAYFYTQRTQPTFCLPKRQARGARDAPPLRFFAAYVVANSFPFRSPLFSFSLYCAALRRLPA